jgi:hypothetical protein
MSPMATTPRSAKCPRKRHVSYEAARLALWVIGQQGKIDTSKLEAKPCPVCRGWHLMRRH